jgi:hypothetical protein
MNRYIAKDGDRLDSVVLANYRSLKPMALVMESNPDLLGKEYLDSGDIVILPFWQPPNVNEVKVLWS